MEENRKDVKEGIDNKKFLRDYEEIFNESRLSYLSSNSHTNHLKDLSQPRFLGSYHLKEAINPKFKAVDNILRGNLEIKYSKALKNTIFNPITISLIVIVLLFNLIWLLLVLL